MKLTADISSQITSIVLLLSSLLPGSYPRAVSVCSITRQEYPDDFNIFQPGCHHPEHHSSIRKYYERLPGLIRVSEENLRKIMQSLTTKSKESWEFMTDVLERGEQFAPCTDEVDELENHLRNLNPQEIVYDHQEIETVHIKWTRAFMCHAIYLHNAKRNAECSQDDLQALAMSNNKIISTAKRLMCTFAPRTLPDDLREHTRSAPTYHVPHSAYRRDIDNYIIMNNFRRLLEKARWFIEEAMEGYMMALL